MQRQPLKKLSAIAMLLLCISLFSHCELEDVQDVRQGIIKSWAQHLIVPGFQDFADRAQQLLVATESFCTAIDLANLEASQNTWRDTRAAYKRLEVFAFGPHKEFPGRYGPAIDTWPAREEDILELLNGTKEISTSVITNGGATKRGLPALEWFLFANPDTLLSETVSNPRRCEILLAIGEDLSLSAQGLAERWSTEEGSFLNELTDPETAQGMYTNSKESFAEIVNRMWFTFENIQRDKLGRPLGNESNGSPQPDNLESRFSQNAIEDIKNNLSMISELFEATDERQGLVSHPRMMERTDLIASFRNQVNKTMQSLDDIDQPLSEAVLESPDSVREVIDNFGELQTLVQVDFMSTLALTLSFNDADGD